MIYEFGMKIYYGLVGVAVAMLVGSGYDFAAFTVALILFLVESIISHSVKKL